MIYRYALEKGQIYSKPLPESEQRYIYMLHIIYKIILVKKRLEVK